MKNKNSIFGIPYEEFKRKCNVAKNEGDLTQKPVVEGEILDPCLRGAKKILEDPEMLIRVRSFLTGSDYSLNSYNIEEIKMQYDIKDNETALRFLEIRNAIKEKKQKDFSNEELIPFLNMIMNYDDMQIWLMENEIKGIKLTLNDELKSNEDILRLYNANQNFDEENINELKKIKMI